MFWRFVPAFFFISVVAPTVHAQRDAADMLPVTTEATVRTVRVSPDPRVVAGKDASLRQAYRDIFKILEARNTCSDFYGGPAAATTVLNQFISGVEHSQLPDFISFRMTGRARSFRDPVSGVSYRLFDKAIVNSEGAFYQRRFDPMQARPRNVGSFAPGTRAARALILLHELGHLIQERNGAWVIRDDGSDSWQSKQNTAQVERNCRAQLSELN